MIRIGRLKGLLAGLCALGLGGVVFATLPVATPVAVAATEAVDPVVTGSVSGTTTPRSGPENGSLAFRQAVEQLKPGNFAAAYELARGLPDATERRAAQWAAIYYGGGEVDHGSVQRFTADAPAFVVGSVFKTRLEQALVKSNAGTPEIVALLGGAMPNTIDAQIALALAYVGDGQKARATRIARSIWVDNYLDTGTETEVLAKLGGLLTRDDHWARAVHLMMNDRATGVERLFQFMTPAQKSLAIARNATSRRDKDGKALLDAVDPAYQNHPVYIFTRAQRARMFDLYASAVDWLDKAKGDLPDSEEWWYERRALVRELLAAGDPKLAYKAAAGYREGPEGRLVEAHFHAGWIALSFIGDASAARQHFEAMRKLSTLPDSVTQANYWLGRALNKLGDAKGARAAFTLAAEHGTVYYGLLARSALGLKGAPLRSMPAWRAREANFDTNEVVRAIRLLAANGKGEMTEPLLRNLATDLGANGADLLLAARLAQAINAHHVAIWIADLAERRGAPLDLFNFPKDGLPSNTLAAVDVAAVYAITRQESHFRADAISRSGALGLMQLMPATAKETAAKLGVSYSKSRLTDDPSYNALLGSTYLANQLQRFDGSLVLAAAAYNAGAGNVNKWLAAYGDPRLDAVDPVVWVELIPFQETRKYVQRVLGNYLVYRARLGDQKLTIDEALRAISG